MTQPADEPTGDEVADGTQLPNDDVVELVEEGDAGVSDTGAEPWYDEDDPEEEATSAAGWDDEDDTDE